MHWIWIFSMWFSCGNQKIFNINIKILINKIDFTSELFIFSPAWLWNWSRLVWEHWYLVLVWFPRLYRYSFCSNENWNDFSLKMSIALQTGFYFSFGMHVPWAMLYIVQFNFYCANWQLFYRWISYGFHMDTNIMMFQTFWWLQCIFLYCSCIRWWLLRFI